MSRLFYIEVSPRGERSKSSAVAGAFIEAYLARCPGDEVERLNLWDAELPSFDGAAMEAKYVMMHGQDYSDEQKRAWGQVEGVIERFKGFDKYVLSVPMWNFSVPYRLKHYIDVITQPGYTFGFNDDGSYKGLVSGRPAVVVYARGGEFSAEKEAVLDYQKRYVETWLGFIGFEDVRSIVVQPTLAGGEDKTREVVARAKAEAARMAEDF